MSEAPIADLNADDLIALADDGPVVMANLVRLRDQARDGAGSGWAAYQRYSAAVVKLIKSRGGSRLSPWASQTPIAGITWCWSATPAARRSWR